MFTEFPWNPPYGEDTWITNSDMRNISISSLGNADVLRAPRGTFLSSYLTLFSLRQTANALGTAAHMGSLSLIGFSSSLREGYRTECTSVFGSGLW